MFKALQPARTVWSISLEVVTRTVLRCLSIKASARDANKATAGHGQPHPQVSTAAVAGQCPLRALRMLPPPPMNVAHETYLWWSKPREWMSRTFAQGSVASGRMLGLVPGVFLGDIKSTKELLSYEAEGAVIPGWPEPFRELLGSEGVQFISDPGQHRFMRKLLAPALSAEAVNEHIGDIQTISELSLAELYSNREAAPPAYPVLRKMTLKVIASVMCGLNLNEEQYEAFISDLSFFVGNLFSLTPFDVWPFPYHHAMNARRRIVARLQEQISLIRAELAAGEAVGLSGPTGSSTLPRRSALHKLLTAKDEFGRGLADKQVIDNLILLFFGANDTMTSHLAKMLTELSQQPEVLARVREEQLQVVVKHGPSITPAAVRDMRYTHAVHSELLRILPPALGFLRQTTQEVVVDNTRIPANSMVVSNLGQAILTDPRWPAVGTPETNPLHPDRFNPDRFLSEDAMQQGEQVPFGLGKHACAGMALAQAQSKVFLASLARSYTVSAQTDTKWLYIPVPRPANQLPTVLTRAYDQ